MFRNVLVALAACALACGATTTSEAPKTAAEVAAMRADLLKQLEQLETMAASVGADEPEPAKMVPKAPLTLRAVPLSMVHGLRCANGATTAPEKTTGPRKETLAQRRTRLAKKKQQQQQQQRQQPSVSSYEHGIRCARGSSNYLMAMASSTTPPPTTAAHQPAIVSSHMHGVRCANGAPKVTKAEAAPRVATAKAASKKAKVEAATAPATTATARALAVSAPSAPAKVKVDAKFVDLMQWQARPKARASTTAPAPAAVTKTAKVAAPAARKARTDADMGSIKASTAAPAARMARKERRDRLRSLKAERKEQAFANAQVTAAAASTQPPIPQASRHHQSATYDSGLHAMEYYSGQPQQPPQPPRERRAAVETEQEGSNVPAVACFLAMAVAGSAVLVYLSKSSKVRRNSFSESSMASAMNSLRSFKPTGLMRRRRCSSVHFTGV